MVFSGINRILVGFTKGAFVIIAEFRARVHPGDGLPMKPSLTGGLPV